MAKVSEYEQTALDFLSRHNITFSVAFVGNDCPKFCEDAEHGRDMDKINTFPRKSHIHGKHYRCTFTRKGCKPLTLDFWNSYADEEHNWAISNEARREIMSSACPYALENMVKEHRKDMTRREPTPYDVLACITKYHPGTFEDFCGEFGYDTDSRKALATYEAVLQEWGKVSAFFTSGEIKEAQEIS